MAEKSVRLGPKSGDAARTTTMAALSDKRRAGTVTDYLRVPKSSTLILKRSRDFNFLAIQLSIDPLVKQIKYVDSLRAMERHVTVEMLVAERHDGQCFGYDLVHERPPRDLDNEGLVLLALDVNKIRLVEVDQNWINAEPRASNSMMIWKHRGHPLDDSARAAITRALTEHGPVAIRKLGEIAGVPYPLKCVCALVWEGIVAVDVSEQPLDLDAVATVAKPTDGRRRPANTTPPPSIREP